MKKTKKRDQTNTEALRQDKTSSMFINSEEQMQGKRVTTHCLIIGLLK